jgi:hypothetical protein
MENAVPHIAGFLMGVIGSMILSGGLATSPNAIVGADTGGTDLALQGNAGRPSRFRAKWIPVRAKKTRQENASKQESR